MSRWFRFYDDVLNDPKVQRLPGDKFKAWVNLLCLASKNGGVLPPLSDCAFALRMTGDRMNALLDEFCKAQLIDPIEVDNAPMSYEPHNWNGRQFKSDVSNERVKRYRERQRNVTETPPDTEQNQKQNQKKETRVSRAVFNDDWPEDYRDQFWMAFPNKVGKPRALAKLDAARRRGVPWAVLIGGLERYKLTKPPDRAWMNPETFLNQERWADEPAVVVPLRKLPDV